MFFFRYVNCKNFFFGYRVWSFYKRNLMFGRYFLFKGKIMEVFFEYYLLSREKGFVYYYIGVCGRILVIFFVCLVVLILEQEVSFSLMLKLFVLFWMMEEKEFLVVFQYIKYFVSFGIILEFCRFRVIEGKLVFLDSFCFLF